MNCLWRPCLLMDRDEISNLYRGPSIDASYQVSVHLAQQFQRRRLKKIGQSETRIGSSMWRLVQFRLAVLQKKIQMWKSWQRWTGNLNTKWYCWTLARRDKKNIALFTTCLMIVHVIHAIYNYMYMYAIANIIHWWWTTLYNIISVNIYLSLTCKGTFCMWPPRS